MFCGVRKRETTNRHEANTNWRAVSIATEFVVRRLSFEVLRRLSSLHQVCGGFRDDPFRPREGILVPTTLLGSLTTKFAEEEESCLSQLALAHKKAAAKGQRPFKVNCQFAVTCCSELELEPELDSNRP